MAVAYVSFLHGALNRRPSTAQGIPSELVECERDHFA